LDPEDQIGQLAVAQGQLEPIAVLPGWLVGGGHQLELGPHDLADL